jgi:hypothetical protein
VVGQRKGPSGKNDPPLHGIKKCFGTASVLNGLKNDPSYEFIGEVILKINVV